MVPNKYCLFILLFLVSFHAISQQQWGLRVGNYGGVQNLIWNPSRSLLMQPSYVIDIASVYGAARNNYAFIENQSILSLATLKGDILPSIKIDDSKIPGKDDAVFDYFYNTNDKFAILKAGIGFPGIVMKLDDEQRIGLFFESRVQFNGTQFPYQLDYYHFDETPFYQKIPSDKFTVSGMAWSSIGLHYARNLIDDEISQGFGVNVKYLLGHEAFYFRNDAPTFVTQLPQDTFVIDKANVNFGFTTSMFNQDRKLKVNGQGIALDLGYSWWSGDIENYDWSFGVGIRDLGFIHFNKNTEQHFINTNDSFRIYQPKYVDTIDVVAKSRLLSQDVFGNPLISLQNNSFTLTTPTAIYVDAEAKVFKNIWLTAMANISFRTHKIGLTGSSSLVFIPRYESKWLSFGLPIQYVLHDRVRVGTYARLGFLTIGADDVFSWFVAQNKLTGGDFYIALQLHSLNFSSNSRNSSGTKKRSNRAIKCPTF